MATGAAWDEKTNPDKPTAELGLYAERVVPVDWNAWLADIDSSYDSHSVVSSAPIAVLGSTEGGGVISVRIANDGTGVRNQRGSFTVHIVAANGEKDHKTLFIKLVAK